MSTLIKGLVFGVMFLLVSATGSHAMTVTVTPSTVDVGKAVSVRIEAKEVQRATSGAEFCTAGNCQLEVNFGDNSPNVTASGRFAATSNFEPSNQVSTFTATHTYSRVGTYTITVRSKNCGQGCIVAAPNPATKTVVVMPETKVVVGEATQPAPKTEIKTPAGTVKVPNWAGKYRDITFPDSVTSQFCAQGKMKFDCSSGSGIPVCTRTAICIEHAAETIDGDTERLCDTCVLPFSPIVPAPKTCPSGFTLACQTGKDVCFKLIK